MSDQPSCDDTDYGDIETPDSFGDILEALNEAAMKAEEES